MDEQKYLEQIINETGYKPTKEQLIWIEDLNKRNYKAVVCRGIDETLFEIQNYLSL